MMSNAMNRALITLLLLLLLLKIQMQMHKSIRSQAQPSHMLLVVGCLNGCEIGDDEIIIVFDSSAM
jgi:hypothetical protein